MTPRAVSYFLYRVSRYLRENPERRRPLMKFLAQHSGCPVTNPQLSHWLGGTNVPRFAIGLAMLRWMQLEGEITPARREQGLFVYRSP